MPTYGAPIKKLSSERFVPANHFAWCFESSCRLDCSKQPLPGKVGENGKKHGFVTSAEDG
jgi:hypothetical protein